MPLPDARPSEKIAKLFPQVDPLKEQPKSPQASAAAPGSKGTPSAPAVANSAAPPPAQPATAVAQATIASPVPLPEARPNIKPAPEQRRRRHYRYYRSGR
jgi:membrane-bound lytic murein transglycosylase A